MKSIFHDLPAHMEISKGQYELVQEADSGVIFIDNSNWSRTICPGFGYG